jgi:hypothetical protein
VATAAHPSYVIDTYEEHQKLLFHICHNFRKKYGGDFDELMGQANLAFMEAYNSFDRKKGEFSKRLAVMVWAALFEPMRKEARRNSMLGKVETPLELFGMDYPHFGQDELSEDARAVWNLVTSMPETLRQDARKCGGIEKAGKRCIYDYFRGMDWPRDRIRNTFQEIREAL